MVQERKRNEKKKNVRLGDEEMTKKRKRRKSIHMIQDY